MKCPPALDTEPERLKALARYGLDGSRPLPSLEPIVRIAARMFGMPIAAVNMIGSDHVFFAAATGFDASQDVDMRRDVSFCAHAITQNEVMVVSDTREDERFHDNPLVLGEAGIRFYAGVPLLSPDGHALGALCVIDGKPRHDFSEQDRERLRELARIASDRLELRRIEIAAAQSAAASDTQAGEQDTATLSRLANTDQLTGLPNRTRFYHCVEEALADAQSLAVFMLDLDGFKDINGTLGNGAGDAVLRALAERLRETAGEDAVAARIGGDEFAVLLPRVALPAAAVSRARELIAKLAEPIRVEGHEVLVSASCGVATAPLHAQEALELIGDADLALHKAKRQGRGYACAFAPAMRQEASTRRLYNIELHRAVSDGQFLLFYQPQVRLSDGALTGAEALIRWQHPQRGLLSPAAFLPALECGPLAQTVGAWVLDEACAQAALWRRSGADDFRIGVNLFGAQLRTDGLVSEVAQALERHGLPPQALELEVTENIVLNQDRHAFESLQHLRDLGVGIAFDDFGTGYASLSLLRQYPVTRLKIDKSFVEGVPGSERDVSMVRAILDMARGFNLEIIAEGVETAPQHACLRQLGCTEGQGYLFGRPLPAPQFAEAFGIGPPVPKAANI